MKHKFHLALFFIAAFTLFACKSTKEGRTKPSKSENYSKYGIDKSGGIPTGVNVGEKAPNVTFHFPDSSKSLSKTLDNGPLVLMFYRGYWCPVCSRYLSGIEDSIAMLKKRGVQVIAVSPELEEYKEKTQQKTQTSISLLSDTSYSIIDAFDVRFSTTEKYQLKINVGLAKDIEKTNGGNSDLPIPATYLIGEDGIIRYKHFDLDYHNRASIRELIEAVDQLPKAR